MKRLRDLRGRGAVITGASSGIGRQLALRMGAQGARLALVARRTARLEELAAVVRAAGGEAVVVPCDLHDGPAATEAAREAERRLGVVDVLVNNAGVGAHRRFLEHDVEDAERLLSVNVLGALRFTRALAPAMVDRGRGWIVFMASIAGLLPVPGESVYAASKFALVGLAESLSIELEPHGIHVLTICPGAVRTEFVPRDEQDRLVPAARRTMVEPERVAETTLAALRAGRHRVVVPASLGAAVALRGIAPSLVRRGTARATRDLVTGTAGERDP